MKLRKNKKGFTIVELVIVIAVIGVLAAVLIPTFINLTDKANKAADDSLVKNLNTALATQEGVIGDTKNNTLHDAIVELEEYGFKMTNFVTKASENNLLWNQETNRFLLEKNIGDEKNKDRKYEFWKIQDSIEESQEYSVYAGNGFNEPDGGVTVSVGFDAGFKNIGKVTYEYVSGDAKAVTIRTNGGELVVNGKKGSSALDSDAITHYGSCNEAKINVAPYCFYTHAKIATMDLQAGKAVAKDGGYVALIKAAADTEAEEAGGIFYIPSGTAASGIDEEVAEALGYKTEDSKLVIDTTTEAGAAREAKIMSTDLIIMSGDELAAFRDMVNNGNRFAGVTVKLGRDIDLNNYNWIPIGQYKDLDGNKPEMPFSGTFDGQGYTIDNMHIIALSSTNTYTSSYRALFGYTDGIVKDFTIKGSIVGTDCAGAVAALGTRGQIYDVDSYVMLTGVSGKKGGPVVEYQEHIQGKTAGICITTKGTGPWTIQGCNNYGDVSTTTNSAAGILSWFDVENNAMNIIDCNNYGRISGGTAPSGGIIGNITKAGVVMTNCTNEGTISGGDAGGLVGHATVGRYTDCTNKGTVNGSKAGGIIGNGYDVRGFNLTNTGTINGTYAAGEIHGYLEYTNIDANEFTFTKAKPAIGIYNPKNNDAFRVIQNADDDTIGLLEFGINANKTATVQIKDSIITTLKCKVDQNHVEKIELNNTSIGTLNLNEGVTGLVNGDTIYIQEVADTINSLGNVNYLGSISSANNTLRVYLGVACTFNYNGSGHAKFVYALDGYTVTNPSTNVWVSTKNS